MAIRADSYSSIAGIVAVTRHLLDGQTTFNSTTLPTLTEVESFVDEASGHLNTALAGAGFTTPVTNSTAKLALSSWVRWRAREYTELTQQRGGFSGEQSGMMSGLYKEANEFVEAGAAGWKQIGAAVSRKSSDGLAFTALDTHTERSDPDDGDREQPMFRRRQFDAP